MSGVPSLFVSRNTVMLFAPVWETNRSPFGAYSIIRADARSSAKMLTLNPSGTLGRAPSGRGMTCDGFGRAGDGAGNWGWRCCPASTAEIEAAPTAIRMTFRFIGDSNGERLPSRNPNA